MGLQRVRLLGVMVIMESLLCHVRLWDSTKNANMSERRSWAERLYRFSGRNKAVYAALRLPVTNMSKMERVDGLPGFFLHGE